MKHPEIKINKISIHIQIALHSAIHQTNFNNNSNRLRIIIIIIFKQQPMVRFNFKIMI